MKKLIITTISALALTLAGAAMAQGGPGGPGGGPGDGMGNGMGGGMGGGPGNKNQQRGMQGMPVVDQVMRGLRRLDLEDEQRVNIRVIMQGMKAEMYPIVQDTRANHLQLRELIKAGSVKEEAIEELAVKEGNMAAERLMIASRALAEVYDQLTGGQRAELEVMAAERMQRRADRRKQRPGQS